MVKPTRIINGVDASVRKPLTGRKLFPGFTRPSSMVLNLLREERGGKGVVALANRLRDWRVRIILGGTNERLRRYGWGCLPGGIWDLEGCDLASSKSKPVCYLRYRNREHPRRFALRESFLAC